MGDPIDTIIEALLLKDAKRINESGCTIYTGFSRDGAEVHDTLRRLFKDSAWRFSQELAWCDAYRVVWISVCLRCTITWCEGDVTLSIAPDAPSFYSELASSSKFYQDN